jgi:murein L,D-transpeptidase YcbB/YkuD
VVWKPGTAIANLVKPGETAPIVSWVRRQLGATAAPGPDNVYDDALKPRVVEFQKSRGLRADGLLGMQTLLNLQTARQDPAVPLLVSPTPR